MKLKNFNFFILIFFLILILSPPIYGQGKIIVKFAQELTESIIEKFGKAGAKELFEFGGEKGVKEFLEKTFLEGGEKSDKKSRILRKDIRSERIICT